MLVTGEFKVLLSSWCKNNLKTSEGSHVNTITLSFGLSQLTCEPTHILPNSSSCIDLIFINQSNFIMNSDENNFIPSRNIIWYDKGAPWFNN